MNYDWTVFIDELGEPWWTPYSFTQVDSIKSMLRNQNPKHYCFLPAPKHIALILAKELSQHDNFLTSKMTPRKFEISQELNKRGDKR